MSRFEFKLPDLGEGTVDAEIVEWKVKVGDQVKEDDVIVDVMTDKANIEVPSPVTGRCVDHRRTGRPGASRIDLSSSRPKPARRSRRNRWQLLRRSKRLQLAQRRCARRNRHHARV